MVLYEQVVIKDILPKTIRYSALNSCFGSVLLTAFFNLVYQLQLASQGIAFLAPA